MALFISEQVAAVAAYNAGNPQFTVYYGENAAEAARQALLAEGYADAAAQSAAFAGGFEVPEYATQAAGNVATSVGDIFRVPRGTTPQTFTWYRRAEIDSDGSSLDLNFTTAAFESYALSEEVSPLATTAALAASNGATLVSFKRSEADARTRTVQSKLLDNISAGDFVGANDTAILNSAISAASTAGLAGRVTLDRDYSVTSAASVVNPYGIEFEGHGRILTPITGGTQQLNTYADAPGRYIYGEEYLDRVMQRLKLGASGSSGRIGCFLYGDSTVAGGYMSMSTVDLVARLFHVRGVGNISITNRGVAGTTVSSLNVLADLSTTTDLAIIKYGINDGGNPDGTRLATFQSTLDSKLTAIRAAANGGRGNLAIVLVGPNATADTPNGRDERWYEQLRGVYVAAARKHKCCYVDVYGYMRDARGGALVGWDDPYGDGRTVHPTDSVGARIWGMVVDAIVPNGWSQWWGTSQFRNVTNTSNAPSASATPSQFLTGVDHARATTGNGWPIDGFVVSHRNPDQGVVQFLYPFAADDTRVLVRTANIGANTWNRWSGVPESLTLQNSWVAYGGAFETAKAYVDSTKTVHLSGMIKSGTTTPGTLICTLPAGMRPAAECIRMGASNAGLVQFKVAPNGEVTLQSAGDASWTSLGGVSFLAA